ncbi:hypothetical protein LB507_008195 [Fusarium sp. FIESC RH6]|nr:hypothetical protein LB507_008195 [Fusarium sp. FIESC RH6]
MQHWQALAGTGSPVAKCPRSSDVSHIRWLENIAISARASDDWTPRMTVTILLAGSSGSSWKDFRAREPSWSETQVWVLLRNETDPMNKETASEEVNAPRPEKLNITFINSLIDEMENACGPVPFHDKIPWTIEEHEYLIELLRTKKTWSELDEERRENLEKERSLILQVYAFKHKLEAPVLRALLSWTDKQDEYLDLYI